MSFAVALKWSFLSELAAKVVASLLFVVLARLLAPEDFGVVAAATMVITFSQIFWDAGMGQAVIQYRGDRAAASDAAFWINCVLALVASTLLFLTANVLAERIFHDERVAAVLQVMSLQFLLTAAVSVHSALLQKDMQFRPLFWMRLSTVALPALISVPLAWQGFGYWALIAGTLGGQAAQSVGLWRISPWRPRLSFDCRVAWELTRFGAWVGASGLLAWFYVWADSLIVGMYLGSHELGVFRTGNQLAMMIFAIPFGPILPVLYSHLSRIGHDRHRLAQAVDKASRAVILLATPIALIVFSLADPLAAALLGPTWEGIGPVVAVMALAHGVSWVIGMNGEVYGAMGKPHYETLSMAATLPIYLVAYVIAIREGLDLFLWTRLALAIGAMLLRCAMLRATLLTNLLPIAGYFLKIAASVAFIVAATHHLGQQLLWGAWPQLLIIGTVDVLLVGSAIVMLERKGIISEITKLMRTRQP
ncbi:MAG: lipopolysaccharide biosynthesis protein [Candidatus Accumulibacter sp.]|uniref:lipopolysaccharide biosynthesis protein n=1 Tax=Accumulibacter sp. TaxID=2053492 RepID=UPI001ACFCFBD|nr:lipopolysaccharide biosynthesis protein [Accumulibacter sp.]MBN8438412.1 lipopolysaccharide biosynthesis protein [Accumulibacter sp.]